jgi:hypothetical protein
MEDGEQMSALGVALYALGVVFLVLGSGLMSGLTLGLLSLDVMDLEVSVGLAGLCHLCLCHGAVHAPSCFRLFEVGVDVCLTGKHQQCKHPATAHQHAAMALLGTPRTAAS